MSDPRQNEAVVHRLIDCINAKDIDVMDELFHDDAIMHWPQSGEVVKGAENRRGVYHAFPAAPHHHPETDAQRRRYRRGRSITGLWRAALRNGVHLRVHRRQDRLRDRVLERTVRPAEWRSQWVAVEAPAN